MSQPIEPLLLGVMGDPIAQSKSPLMHESALKASSIQGRYVPLHVLARDLPRAIEGIRAMNFRGVNVTVPHKVEVMPLLDHIDEAACRIGAVNTIVNDHGVLTGYNTDGIGYVRSLKEEVTSNLEGSTILVIGAGGAARGIIYALLQERPAQIIIANRTLDKAEKLVEEWSDIGHLTAISMDDASKAASEADIVVNTTSVGMVPDIHELPLVVESYRSGAVFSDLIYNPLQTEFLRQASLQGCRVHSGLGMFIYQGAYAFEYWTGVTPDIEKMRQAVLDSLSLKTRI
ncbi:shikimate dehydrogenase [Paenibacillus shirakamiensis]|uniref:Shikimate dehydrogenase (NADP(+)) n=1 Tax=Paenibacillus shirakamiensis TaxID=1265935 RepID=A0ABS4JBL9_9BACL|nr:shikimate dehydrogenase [Paenibacillus shirakamiensis]MBP1999115.1 shikimate dehydrogenase [Paenibacillus shirakamiensis]